MSIVTVKTKTSVAGIIYKNLDKQIFKYDKNIQILGWNKFFIPCDRRNINDILIDGESIKHGLNSGLNLPGSFEIWLHSDLSKFYTRISMIAQDDLVRFKNLNKKYLITESWNEKVSGEFIPKHIKNFFASGDGPNWYAISDFHNLPYIRLDTKMEKKQLDLTTDLVYNDKKFYGQGKCRSLQAEPELPTVSTRDLKNQNLRVLMEEFGFTDMLQIQYVELQPNSVLPIHRDDFTYVNGKHLIDGPTQLYYVLSGSVKDIKFKFKNVGLIDVDTPIFINNHRFVHSLVYTGEQPRGVLLAYGINKFTNKNFI